MLLRGYLIKFEINGTVLQGTLEQASISYDIEADYIYTTLIYPYFMDTGHIHYHQIQT